jgi:hypothetical protein
MQLCCCCWWCRCEFCLGPHLNDWHALHEPGNLHSQSSAANCPALLLLPLLLNALHHLQCLQPRLSLLWFLPRSCLLLSLLLLLLHLTQLLSLQLLAPVLY